jgi:adenylate kinase
MSKVKKKLDDNESHVPSKKEKIEEKIGPNILITGTPGVGKSALCRALTETDPESIQWINIGSFAKENDLLGDFDETYQCHELEEDKIIDELEITMQRMPKEMATVTSNTRKRVCKTVLIDHQVTDFFPERWFDIVFVLRTDNTTLYDRLGDNGRGYSGKKLEDNIQCEIFQTILDEAKESYQEEIVHELQSNSDKDLKQNVDRILSWISQWSNDNI